MVVAHGAASVFGAHFREIGLQAWQACAVSLQTDGVKITQVAWSYQIAIYDDHKTFQTFLNYTIKLINIFYPIVSILLKLIATE